MLSKQELEQMKAMDIREADIDSLVDIRDVQLDENLPIQERWEEFVRQVKNPYMVRMGDYVIKLCYSDCEETIEDRMREYIARMVELEGELDDLQ
jgi:hypothetical protein